MARIQKLLGGFGQPCMALDFATIITRPNVVHKQQVKHNINTFKLYIRNKSLKIKIIRLLNYFLLLKLNVGSELSCVAADRSIRRRRSQALMRNLSVLKRWWQTRPWQVDLYRGRQRR